LKRRQEETGFPNCAVEGKDRQEPTMLKWDGVGSRRKGVNRLFQIGVVYCPSEEKETLHTGGEKKKSSAWACSERGERTCPGTQEIARSRSHP